MAPDVKNLIIFAVAVGLPLFFAAMWLGVTSLLGLLSGWFSLMRIYPDTPEPPLLKLGGQSGWMGPLAVNMNGVLTLSACASGLRVGIMRMLGPFSSNLFVPWGDIHAERRKRFFIQTVTLSFGSPVVGTLDLQAKVADRLAKAAGAGWPEPGPIPPET